jgi:hypothetical protein
MGATARSIAGAVLRATRAEMEAAPVTSAQLTLCPLSCERCVAGRDANRHAGSLSRFQKRARISARGFSRRSPASHPISRRRSGQGSHLGHRRAHVSLPWIAPRGGRDDLRATVKRIIRAAGLRDELGFTSFRHGGFTEGAEDSDLSDAELRAARRYRVGAAVADVREATRKQLVSGVQKRRAERTNQPFCRNGRSAIQLSS